MRQVLTTRVLISWQVSQRGDEFIVLGMGERGNALPRLCVTCTTCRRRAVYSLRPSHSDYLAKNPALPHNQVPRSLVRSASRNQVMLF